MRHSGMQVSLQLTSEQKERLLAARTYLLAQMMEIIQERTLIISMLQVWPCCNPAMHPQAHIALPFHPWRVPSSSASAQPLCLQSSSPFVAGQMHANA